MYSQAPLQSFITLLRNAHTARHFDLLEQWWKVIRRLPTPDITIPIGHPSLFKRWTANLLSETVAIQGNLVNPQGQVVALHELKNWDDGLDDFAMRAYDWLHFLMECGSSESGLRSIAFTRPYMERATRDLASHEVSQNIRTTRNENEVIEREYKGLITSVADFWVQDSLARAMTNHATTEEETRDIRRLPRDQVEMVRKMVEALKNMAEKRDGKDYQINQLRISSHHVFENIAWQLWVSYHFVKTLFDSIEVANHETCS